MSPSWSIRRYAESDLRDVARIHLSSFSSIGIKRGEFRTSATKNLPGKCLVAVSPSKEILGYVIWTERKDGTLYCNWIAVAKAHSRRGIARALMSALQRLARRTGHKRLEIDTRNRFRAALAFYIEIGFDVVEVWRAPDRDLMIKMRRTLAE
jgi:ribosomal protein S18 acetylase RimI-like enzyme